MLPLRERRPPRQASVAAVIGRASLSAGLGGCQLREDGLKALPIRAPGRRRVAHDRNSRRVRRWAEEHNGSGGRKLAHAPGLLRGRDSYIRRCGQASCDLMPGDCLWHVYAMIAS